MAQIHTELGCDESARSKIKQLMCPDLSAAHCKPSPKMDFGFNSPRADKNRGGAAF